MAPSQPAELDDPRPAYLPGTEQTSSRLAAELLDAVECGSTATLLEVLSSIARIDTGSCGESNVVGCMECERLELLRAIALQLRLDLHAMLMHIYQRLEASRAYLDMVRNLAGRPHGGASDLGNALPSANAGGMETARSKTAES
ncbi:MAG: hypothetical protein LC114_27805 [Bryobacterales bacterium]|nr:hypothetical protein [Bryobacterales bacterium]